MDKNVLVVTGKEEGDIRVTLTLRFEFGRMSKELNIDFSLIFSFFTFRFWCY